MKEETKMAVLLADRNSHEGLKEVLETRVSEVIEVETMTVAEEALELWDYNAVVVDLGLEHGADPMGAFMGDSCGLMVVGRCFLKGIPCVVIHENEPDDWNARMASDILSATVITRLETEDGEGEQDEPFFLRVADALECAISRPTC